MVRRLSITDSFAAGASPVAQVGKRKLARSDLALVGAWVVRANGGFVAPDVFTSGS